MALKVYLKPDQAWEFFKQNKKRLEDEMVEIATNDDTRTVIYLTEEEGHPAIKVYRNDIKQYEEGCVSLPDCEKTLKRLYTKYLTPLQVVVNNTGKKEDADDDDDDAPVDEEVSRAEFEAEIEEREEVIYQAVSDLIDVLTEDNISSLEFSDRDDDSVGNIVDHIVRYLAVECGFRIRRPMILFDEDKKQEVCTEYPYEEYDFSDDEEKGDGK